MAKLDTSNQLLYVGRGPLDAKQLVKTYAELTDEATWTVTSGGTNTLTAYNGMIVTVWLNKEDTSKNGIYYLYDSNVTTALKKPDVKVEGNWHKLCSLGESNDINEDEINALIDAKLEGYVTKQELDESKKINIKTVAELPNVGDSSYFYECDDGLVYVWDTATATYKTFAAREIRVLDGGTAADFI